MPPERDPGVGRQYGHARSDLLLRLAHAGVPWALFALLTVAGNVLVLLGHVVPAFRAWQDLTAGLTLGGGLALAALDLHLRGHRMSVAGKAIGPVTTTAASAMLATFTLAGYSVPLVLLWAFGGAGACIGWDLWQAFGVHHDLGQLFTAQAEKAGLGGARLVRVSRPKAPPAPAAQAAGRRASRPRVPAESGVIEWPRGQVTPAEAAEQVARIEGVRGYPPGAMSLSPDPDDAGMSGYRITDPAVLERATPWPGPYAPGAGMSVPFRYGDFQDGTVALVPRLPLFHTRAMGQTGSGKALKLDTPVPVPSGWTTMGELRDGDTVFDDAGQPCRVVKAHPVLLGHPCYEVAFSDGSVITACADHLWTVDTASARRSADNALIPDLRPRKTSAHRPQQYKHFQPQVVTTAGLAAGLRDSRGALQYSVRVAAPLQCAEADLPVPPYTLGAWLGDGTTLTGSITSVDQEILSEIEAEGLTVRVVPSTAGPGKAPLYRVVGLSRLLLAAGVRERIPGRYTGKGTLRGVKHIPVTYQRASESQRRALLAGLLDTDGSCTPGGNVTFSVTSERLARDVLHLVSGLGYKATLRSRPARLYGRDCGTAWTVSFTPADKVFRLARKAVRQVTTVRRTALRRYVTDVRPVESTPVRCITVDSPSSLYLAGQACIPTHNTMSWGYCQLGEGVTREGYAAMVIDISKGEQFFGAWRPALHRFETGPERALYLLRGLHRARLARANFLAKSHRTEWEDGCGLSFLDVFMAEAPDIIALLETARSRAASAVMSLADWSSDVKNSRSAGMAWNLDLQLTHATEVPSVAQGQMSHLCLGVEEKEEARFGLSARQRDAGCRPELWGKKKPGMAYWDAPTLADEYGVMPMRFFHWQGGARQAFEYAGLYPATDRPLDDVTGEALEAEPGPPASHALPGPGGTLPGARPDPRDAARWGKNVRPLFRQPAPDVHDEAAKAENLVRAQLEEWLTRKGKDTFTSLELQKTRVHEKAGRSRAWLYDVIATFEQTGLAELVTDKPRKRWRILPAVVAPKQDSGEEEEG
jgi:LAGLIDADG DNA endonuclease family protein